MKQDSISGVPLVTIPGGTKRKKSIEMAADKNYKFSSENLFSEPQTKQRKYEERMSNKLGSMHIGKEPSTHYTPQHQSKPRIEEILDWDEELLDDETTSTTPIVEEPSINTEPENEERLAAVNNDIEEFRSTKFPNEHQSDDEDDELQNTEINSEQKIVLSQELRQFINNKNINNFNHINADQSSLFRRTNNISTGKELILYTPSSLSQRMPHSTPIFDSKAKNEQQINNESVIVNQQQFEEVLDEKVLPDATNTPRVDSSSDDSSLESVGIFNTSKNCFVKSPLTPPPTEAIISDDEFQQKTQLHRSIGLLHHSIASFVEDREEDVEEDAMEID